MYMYMYNEYMYSLHGMCYLFIYICGLRNVYFTYANYLLLELFK